jgi:hypothetical protein
MPLSSVVGAQSIIKPGVCTSSTRPAVPFVGQGIYETDTYKTLFWNGSGWYPSWGTAWGTQNLVTVTTPDTTITAEEVQITGGSFTAVANRYYKVTYFEPDPYSVTASGFFGMRIRLTNLAGAQKTVGYAQLPTSGTTNRTTIVEWVGTLSAGTTNFVATMQSQTGTAACDRAATYPAFLLVEDIGPA